MSGRNLIIAVAAASLFLFWGGEAAAQYNSRSSFGLRLGNEIAVDYKYQFTTHHGLDLKAGVVNPFTFHYQFLVLSAAYHYSFGVGSRRLFPYVGAGLSTGMQFGHWNEAESAKITYFLSVDVPVGFEYRLVSKPVVFCLEWSPKAQLLSYRRFLAQSVAVGVRYIFPQYVKYRKKSVSE